MPQRKEYFLEYGRKHRQKIRTRAFKWARAHPERNRARANAYYWLHRDEINAKKQTPEFRERVNKQRWKYAHKAREWILRREYGLTPKQYDDMTKAQRGRCAICGSYPVTRRLHIDHCHKTNRVRGLLCIRCNHGIGFLKDDVAILSKAIEYLTHPPGVPS